MKGCDRILKIFFVRTLFRSSKAATNMAAPSALDASAASGGPPEPGQGKIAGMQTEGKRLRPFNTSNLHTTAVLGYPRGPRWSSGRHPRLKLEPYFCGLSITKKWDCDNWTNSGCRRQRGYQSGYEFKDYVKMEAPVRRVFFQTNICGHCYCFSGPKWKERYTRGFL